MKFEKAKENYLGEICTITAQAKRQLKELGLSQWQKGYPSEEVWTEDIACGNCYVAVEAGRVLGVFAFQEVPDASYYEIDGKWLTDGAYASMHRVCVADGCKGTGVAGAMFAFGFEMAREKGFAAMRIDTHPGNLPMQRALEKAGFEFCGKITLADGCEKGDARIAFEKVLKG